MRRLNGLIFGSPFSQQAGMVYVLMTSTAAADYLNKYVDMGHAAASESTAGSWRHSQPRRMTPAEAAAAYNREEMLMRQLLVDHFGAALCERAKEYTIP